MSEAESPIYQTFSALTLPIEEVPRVFPIKHDPLRYISHELYDVRDVVLVPAVVVARVGLEQVVARGQLEGHAGRGPDVCRGPVPGAQQHLQTAVLPGLDVLREVVVLRRFRK